MTTIGLGAALATTLVFIGCGRKTADGPVVTVRNGVRLVENSHPGWSVGQEWTVDSAPLVDIGGDSSAAEFELSETLGPLRLGDGRIVLLNGGTNELRFYDSAGGFLRRAGRVGKGPGEFQNVTGLWITPGDSLVVVQSFERRLSIFDSSGTYRRSVTLQGGGGQFMVFGAKPEAVGPIGCFSDGSVLMMSQLPPAADRPRGVYRDTTLAMVHGPDGAVVDTVGRFPAAELETVSLKAGPETVAAPGLVPLGKETLVAVRGDRWAVAKNDAWEVEVHRPNGSVSELIRAALPARLVTAADIAAHRHAQLAMIEARRGMPDFLKAQLRNKTEQARYPERLPFFDALLFDEDGHLWASDAGTGVAGRRTWTIIDTSGVWLGSVAMPASFRPTFIASAAAYGVWRDENDVEHVRVYRLRRQ